MQTWTVAGGLLMAEQSLLLVRNRRRNGSHDWSPPGGVIDEGESVLEGLTREVAEETGLVVGSWRGPVYEVRVDFVDIGWELNVESYVALSWQGALTIDDPDGIVVDARFCAEPDMADCLTGSPRWVQEPLRAWAAAPDAPADYRYRASGRDPQAMVVERL